MTHSSRSTQHQRSRHIGGVRSWSVGFLVALSSMFLTAAAFATCPTCSSNPCTLAGSYTIASGDSCNYAGYDVILTGTFNGDNNAACYTVTADSLTVRGTLRARSSCVNVNVTGNFKTESVSNSAATVDVRDADSAGDGVFVTCGSATINGKAIIADADGDFTPPYYPSGDIEIICSGAISGTGGPITADAVTGDDAGTITIVSTGSTVNLSSAQSTTGAGSNSYGGYVYVEGASDVTLGSASHAIAAESAGGGYAGTIEIVSGGTATINGPLNVNGNGLDSSGGAIAVSGVSVTTGTTWNAKGDQGGDGGTIDVTADGGTVATTSGSASWNATGASYTDDGGWGGAITVAATGNVTLNGDMDAGGNGVDASGGTIDISTDGNITVANTSRLEADSTGTDASDGAISFAGCSITVSGDVDTRNTNLYGGYNSFDYGGTFTQNNGSSVLADDDGGNDIWCRCVDTSPADGVCDTPVACASAPTINGTMTPAANVIPYARASCG